MDYEIDLKDVIKEKLDKEIDLLKEEILIGKRILRDPNLCQLATRKFKTTIDRVKSNKFLLYDSKGKAINTSVTDILQKGNDEVDVNSQQFEVELIKSNDPKLKPN